MAVNEVHNESLTAVGSENGQLQLVTFGVGTEEFAIDILLVREINRMMAITKVPESPSCVDGVINLRGRIVPVLDLRKLFKMDWVEHQSSSRIIVVDVSGQTVGFVVDCVHEVLRIASNIVESAPSMTSVTVDSSYIQGIGKMEDRLLILLDLARLFNMDELRQLQQVSQETVSKHAA